MDADAGDTPRNRSEGDLVEACRAEPVANACREIRQPTVASPNDGRTRDAERGQCLDGGVDITVGDISEHSASEYELRRGRPDVRVADARVSRAHVDRIELETDR